MKLRVLFPLLACLLCSANPGLAQDSAARKLGSLRFEPYRYQFEGRTIEAELGRLVVKENRRIPNSNLIELAFVRLKSTASNPGPPTIYLDGGPGSSPISLGQYAEYLRAFLKLREVGDVILLDQRGVGLSRPNLTTLSLQPLPLDFFADEAYALRIFKERIRNAAESFRGKGVDLAAYNTIENANDIDDLRNALGVAKVNLVGFSYGTHLGLAAIRYHGDHLNRVALMGTEGPNHTEKLPSTSQKYLVSLSKLVAQDPTVGSKVPDLVGLLKRILDRLGKEPATVRINDRAGRPLDVKVGKFALQLILMIDLCDTSDLPVFPALLYTIDKGDYSILARFVEKRYHQIGAGVPVMRLVMDSSSGATRDRIAQIKREAGDALLGNVMNFLDVGDVFGNPDLGDEYRSPIHTSVPTLFFSGTLDSSCPPFQADEVRKYFQKSVHITVGNAGHEDMVTNPKVQQAVVDYFNGGDVTRVKIELPPVRFLAIPEIRTSTPVK